MEIKEILKICEHNIKYENIIELLENKVLYSSNVNNLIDLKKYSLNIITKIEKNNNNEFIYYIYYNIDINLYKKALSSLKNKKFEMKQVHSKTKYKYYKENDLQIYLSDNIKQEYLVIKEYKNIYILSKNKDESRCLLYVIREIIRIVSENKRNIILHAGCVRNSKQNILMVGDSGSGKTTLIFQLLAKADFEFVSNDRTIVDNDLRTFEFPIKVRVGFETINHIKTLQKFIISNNINKIEDDKIILYPKDINRWKKQKEKDDNKTITKIIIPNINPKIKNNIEKLSQYNTKIILEKNCYVLDDPEWKNKWFEKDYFFHENEIEKFKEKIIKKLVKNVRTYRINYNGIVDNNIINMILED